MIRHFINKITQRHDWSTEDVNQSEEGEELQLHTVRRKNSFVYWMQYSVYLKWWRRQSTKKTRIQKIWSLNCANWHDHTQTYTLAHTRSHIHTSKLPPSLSLRFEGIWEIISWLHHRLQWCHCWQLRGPMNQSELAVQVRRPFIIPKHQGLILLQYCHKNRIILTV